MLTPFAFFTTATFEPSTYTWTLKQSSSQALREPSLFALNGKLYSKGGFIAAVTGNNYQYTPSTNTWATKTAGYSGRGSGAFTIGTMSHVFAGFGASYLTTHQAYDDVNNIWISKTAYPAGLYAVFAFAGATYGYAGGGNNATWANGTASFYRYDQVANTWTAMSFLPGNVLQPYCFVIGDYAYVCCGQTNVNIKKVYRYSFSGNTWTTLSDFPGTARRNGIGFALNGKGYIWGGFDTAVLAELWEYEPSNDTWTQKTSSPIARTAYSVGNIDLINDVFYFANGWDAVSNKSDTYSLTIT